MSRRRLRLVAATGALLVLVTAAIVAAVVTGPSAAPAAAVSEEVSEMAPAMQAKLAQQQTFAPPGSKQEGDRTAADDEWMKHAIPGDTIPSAAIEQSSGDWAQLSSRSAEGSSSWKPLGPTWAKGLPNPYRDRAVYNAGTPDFSGRIAHTVIDPNCAGSRGDDDDDDDGGGSCRLWIANANGGVWRTNNALSKQPSWKYLSKEFEHNSVASLELDPNDKRSNTIYAGTGEPNACGSGCEAGVGIYKSTNGGERWSGPFGKTAGPACGPGNPSPCEPFYNRAVGSIEVKPGDSKTIFAATGRAIRGLTSSCCGGADALIPGAAHFGLYRSQDGGGNWQLVNQGAPTNCTADPPDTVSLGGTPCSPRGARRVMVDPVDPNTVYASFFARGIWRSNQNGDENTWTQILPPVGPLNNNERPEFDIVTLPNGATRMYVGVGGGAGPDGPDQGTAPDPTYARFLRSDSVRTGPAVFVDLTSPVQDTPGYSSFGYCDGQCSYDSYVFAPAHHFPNSGATADTVYLSGDNEYNENDWGPLSPRYGGSPFGRSNGRGVALTTNGGAAPGTQYFTDMTDDDSHDLYPFELHPDHHALTVNPRNYKQFFDVGDGGIVRSNGKLIDDSGDCVQPKGYQGTRLTFCQLMLSSVPERLEAMNKGLRTLHFYQIDVSPFDNDTIVGGTQDNGSWERGDGPGSGTNSGPSGALPPFGVGIDTDKFPSERECLGRGRGDDDDDDNNGNSGSGGEQIWVNTNIADGGHNGFDLGDPCFRLSGFQQGQTMVSYDPKNQLDMNWTSDTHFVFYGNELNAFIGVANDDHTVAARLWSARQHAFRSDNQGRNPVMTKQQHRQHCNVWYGDGDVDENGTYEPPNDICDDWTPLGDPGPAGRLTDATTYGATKSGGYVSVIEPAWDGQTLWTATQVGRVLVSKNAGGPEAAVVFDRIDDDATAVANSPNRFVSAIYVDPKDANHAWIVYSGFNAKDPIDGHIFEVRYVPGASTFTLLDGNEPRDRMGDIPATSVAVTDKGTIYVGTDYGVIASKGDGVWRQAGKGLPRMPAPDLMYIPGKKKLYAATHGQGVWELKVHDIEDDD